LKKQDSYTDIRINDTEKSIDIITKDSFDRDSSQGNILTNLAVDTINKIYEDKIGGNPEKSFYMPSSIAELFEYSNKADKKNNRIYYIMMDKSHLSGKELTSSVADFLNAVTQEELYWILRNFSDKNLHNSAGTIIKSRKDLDDFKDVRFTSFNKSNDGVYDLVFKNEYNDGDSDMYLQIRADRTKENVIFIYKGEPKYGYLLLPLINAVVLHYKEYNYLGEQTKLKALTEKEETSVFQLYEKYVAEESVKDGGSHAPAPLSINGANINIYGSDIVPEGFKSLGFKVGGHFVYAGVQNGEAVIYSKADKDMVKREIASMLKGNGKIAPSQKLIDKLERLFGDAGKKVDLKRSDVPLVINSKAVSRGFTNIPVSFANINPLADRQYLTDTKSISVLLQAS
jgi:hypothetical protein